MAGVETRVEVVTFTATERAAVSTMMTELEAAGWSRVRGVPQTHGRDLQRPVGSQDDSWRLTHTALRAQGNVVVGAELARTFTGRRTPPDYVVFFGCAGAIHEANVGGAYLVAEPRYLSLGTVDHRHGGAPGEELVTLKNKWICAHVDDSDVYALPTEVFPLVGGSGTRDLRAETGIDPARVLATDKVVRVPPGAGPPPGSDGNPNVWPKAEWTYGEAMAHVIETSSGLDVLVEMESYGIAAVTRALSLGEKVVVLRIATDALADKTATDGEQGALLMNGRLALLELIKALFGA